MTKVAVTPEAFSSLDARAKRRLIVRSITRTLVIGAVIITAYFLVPLENISAADTVIRLVGGIALFVAAVAWQVRSIAVSRYPQAQAIEAVGMTVWLLTTVFAIVYVSLSVLDPLAFTEPLRPVTSLYFTTTVIATVGFGDISPVTDAARIIVTLQMFLDLLLAGIIVRLFLRSAQTRLRSVEGQ
jgi:voltage-gated potassium channel